MNADKRKVMDEGWRFLGSLLGTFVYAVGINLFVVILLSKCEVVHLKKRPQI